MIAMKANSISADELQRFRDDILKPSNRSIAQMSDPVAPGEVGPNGHRIGYLKNGDKVEWIPDEGDGEWPMILRRNDKSVVDAQQKFLDIIWYDRKLVMFASIKDGDEKALDPAQEARVRAAMEKVERKYGKRKIRQFYKDDFEWGMLNGKLSALRWVLGDDWDNLDT